MIFRYRFWFSGKEQVLTLGSYPAMTLADARLARNKAQLQVSQGIHPGKARHALRQRAHQSALSTFQAVAAEWMPEAQKGWCQERRLRIERLFDKKVFPAIGSFPIEQISPADVRNLVLTISKEGAPSIAKLVLQICGAVFRHAMDAGLISNDPTYTLRRVIKVPPVRHRTPIEKQKLPTFMRKLDAYADTPTKSALQLLLLTFVRPKEMRTAEWNHIDLNARTWKIPSRLTKSGEPHFVPLSLQAIEILKNLKLKTGGKRFLFPNVRRPDAFMGPTTLNRALEYLGFKKLVSAHAFRATASTLLHEEGYDTDLIEKQLGHSDRDRVRASYNQAAFMPLRRKMMQEWADYLDRLSQEAMAMSTGNVQHLKTPLQGNDLEALRAKRKRQAQAGSPARLIQRSREEVVACPAGERSGAAEVHLR